MNIIKKYSEFVFNESLITHNIDLTIKNVKSELNLLRYDFEIYKENNIIVITLNNFSKTQNIILLMDNLNSLMVDRHGWFPFKMKLLNFFNMEKEESYDEEYIIDNISKIEKIHIYYESKYGIEENIPDKLFHLSIQEHENKISRNGLIPKSKSKLTRHLDRIYLCKTIDGCKHLISRMKLHFSDKNFNKIDTRWIIYEIDTNNLKIKLYKDSNYSNGYYCVDNIPKENIKVIERE